jgi:hypothetical protein
MRGRRREREGEREKFIDNQESLDVGKHNALSWVTLPLGARAPALTARTSLTLCLAMWPALADALADG